LGLEAVADMDPLTGLNNRRFLYKEFPALQRQTELGQSLSMALLDIDYFKSINDLHGHLAGDAVLRQVASELSRAMADLGHVVRFGGEEFAIVLTSCPLPEAKEVCSALLSHLASISFSIGRKQSIHITASIGATCVWPTDSFESALSRADAALYAAKRAGRDRVSTQGPCMEQLAHRQ
ncbi:MAG: GGDEF domain-containing protein, partial [Planctomycetales bacterium]|nr:GGDEF domain-containing protein [Planctomycetales bacterium]